MNQRYRTKNKKNTMAKSIASQSKPGAWIVNPKDKGRKSIKSGKCFLENDSNFEIELFNPLTVSVLADIKLNGQSISKTGLVVKPGQRVYLDCFIDDKKKFIFKTYDVEDTGEVLDAIQKNGLLEVFFYKEDVIALNNWKTRFDRIIVEKWYPYYHTYPSYPNIWCSSGGYSGTVTTLGGTTFTTNSSNALVGTTTTSNAFYSNVNCSYTSGVDLSNLNINGSNNMTPINSIETGRIEKGNKSKQKFTEVDMDFENHYIHSVIILILPESRKPAEVKEIFNKKTGEIKFKKESNDDVIELIKKLADLHSAGILTDDEFSEKKTELLTNI